MPLKKEQNWRLNKDLTKGKYCYLIEVDNWAIELQKKEFRSLCLLLIKINEQFLDVRKELMEEELINLELEQLPWYLELDGKKNEWSLRIIFESQDETRSFQMYWPIPIAETLSYEIRKMWESM